MYNVGNRFQCDLIIFMEFPAIQTQAKIKLPSDRLFSTYHFGLTTNHTVIRVNESVKTTQLNYATCATCKWLHMLKCYLLIQFPATLGYTQLLLVCLLLCLPTYLHSPIYIAVSQATYGISMILVVDLPHVCVCVYRPAILWLSYSLHMMIAC